MQFHIVDAPESTKHKRGYFDGIYDAFESLPEGKAIEIPPGELGAYVIRKRLYQNMRHHFGKGSFSICVIGKNVYITKRG